MSTYSAVGDELGGSTSEELFEEVRRAAADGIPASIAVIDRLVAQLHAEGKDLEAMRYRERSILLRKEEYGLRSEDVQNAVSELCLWCNTLAMRYLREERYNITSQLLKKAEVLTQSGGALPNGTMRLKLRAVTLNNLGCYYKSQGKFHAALNALERALKIEQKTEACDNPAGTHINICVILSQLGRHRLAAQHARAALKLMEYEAEAFEAAKREEEGEAADDAAATGLDGDMPPFDDDEPVGPVDPEAAARRDGVDEEAAADGSGPAADGDGVDEEAAGELTRVLSRAALDSSKVEEEDGVDADVHAEDSSIRRHVDEAEDEEARRMAELRNEMRTPAAEEGADGAAGDGAGDDGDDDEPGPETTSLLGIAHFNLAVELEYLGKIDAAVASYRRACAVTERDLGVSHPMTTGMRRTLEEAQKKAALARKGYSLRVSPRQPRRGVRAPL
eukprot:PLAT4722.1.p1 GENE.PLAT4722.1~~PLAT4722.1.p1  ORF type:complete len:470 (-),score=239.64 PLAT4722.1:126-1472(-)